MLLLTLMLVSGNGYGIYQVEEIGELENQVDAYLTAISSDGYFAALASEGNDTVTIYKAREGTIFGSYSVPVDAGVESMCFSDNGKYLYIGTQNKGIICINSAGVHQWSFSEATFPGEVNVHKPNDANVLYIAARQYFKRLDLNTMAITTDVAIDARTWSIWDIDSSNDGSVVMLKTNSDVILVNPDGVEIGFFDICDGNNLTSCDLSPDGTRFAASFYDSALSKRMVASYKVATGMHWSAEISSYGMVVMDENYNTYCGVSLSDNILFGPDGGEILTWNAENRHISVTPNGQYAISYDKLRKFKLLKFTDNFNCYPNLKVRAYLTNVYQLYPTVNSYTITIANWQELPEDMFIPSPELTACGFNKSASRTYIDIYGSDGAYYFSGCGSRSYSSFPSEFQFAVNSSVTLNDYVYIEFYDRKCDQFFRTNLMDTSSICPMGDLNGDCTVDLIDFSILAANWLVSL